VDEELDLTQSVLNDSELIGSGVMSDSEKSPINEVFEISETPLNSPLNPENSFFSESNIAREDRVIGAQIQIPDEIAGNQKETTLNLELTVSPINLDSDRSNIDSGQVTSIPSIFSTSDTKLSEFTTQVTNFLEKISNDSEKIVFQEQINSVQEKIVFQEQINSIQEKIVFQEQINSIQEKIVEAAESIKLATDSFELNTSSITQLNDFLISEKTQSVSEIATNQIFNQEALEKIVTQINSNSESRADDIRDSSISEKLTNDRLNLIELRELSNLNESSNTLNITKEKMEIPMVPQNNQTMVSELQQESAAVLQAAETIRLNKLDIANTSEKTSAPSETKSEASPPAKDIIFDLSAVETRLSRIELLLSGPLEVKIIE